MSFRFFKETKPLSAALCEIETFIAQSDFRDPLSRLSLQEKFQGLEKILTIHSQYEKARLEKIFPHNSLLLSRYSSRNSDEALQKDQVKSLILDLETKDPLQVGDDLYLTYSKFVSEILAHLHEIETVVLPELEKNYSEVQLRQLEQSVYNDLTADEILEWMRCLFPYLNAKEREEFILSLQELQPEKFLQIAPIIEERAYDMICN
jgi:hypothetical protein